jgi:EAL domain-containing protein (putative c-di-GMP-specific phosphodiesterase class I)
VTLIDQLERTRRTRSLIEELIADPCQLGPDFQPIWRLADLGTGTGNASPVGWKATGRGRPGTDLTDTLALLSGAQSLGLVERLDWAFRCHTFDVAVAAGIDVPLHITPEPETFGSPCPPRLTVSFGRGRRGLDVVAELHEDSFDDRDTLRRAVAEMRGWGWQLVVADVADSPQLPGVLDDFSWLRPEFVQVDVSRPGRSSVAPNASVRRLLEAARTGGAQVMAVGIDLPAAVEGARRLGAVLGRGRALGEPGPL